MVQVLHWWRCTYYMRFQVWPFEDNITRHVMHPCGTMNLQSNVATSSRLNLCQGGQIPCWICLFLPQSNATYVELCAWDATRTRTRGMRQSHDHFCSHGLTTINTSTLLSNVYPCKACTFKNFRKSNNEEYSRVIPSIMARPRWNEPM